MYIHGYDSDPKPTTILPLSFWIAFACFALLAFFATDALADPVYAADVQGIRIILTNEKCALSEVSNLPYRATWTQDGKTFEWCFGIASGVVMAYFKDDRSVAAIPTSIFRKVQGA